MTLLAFKKNPGNPLIPKIQVLTVGAFWGFKAKKSSPLGRTCPDHCREDLGEGGRFKALKR